MKVFVTGGTGAIGRPAVAALLAAGHEVSALARTPEKAAALARRGASPAIVSLFDREALSDAFRGHDAVVNLATALPPSSKFHMTEAWAENNRIRTVGSATVADAALDAKVPRLVQESVCMTYRDGGHAWLDENAAIDDFPAARGNLAAETSARRFTAAGGTGVVLRFGWFYGPGAAHSEMLLRLARRWRLCCMLGAPTGYVSSIHVEDGGRAVAAALDVGAGAYNVVDNAPLLKRDYADALAAAAGRRLYLRAPGRLAVLAPGMTSLTRSLRVSNRRFRAAAAWEPRFASAREGWPATAARLGAASTRLQLERRS